MADRPRRQPVVSSGRAGAKAALEALKAARESGGAAKRAAAFEVRKEAAVYDVLDEAEYAKLVAKRREEGGDFIVNDDGQGYADLGEDDHWRQSADSASEAGSDEEGADGSAPKKRRKGDASSKGEGKGRKKRSVPGGTDAGSGNVAKMFSKAAAKAALAGPPKPSRAAAPVDTDALLADILDDLGSGPSVGPSTTAAAPFAAGGGAASMHRAATGPGARQGFGMLVRGPTPLTGRPAQAAVFRPRPSGPVQACALVQPKPEAQAEVGPPDVQPDGGDVLMDEDAPGWEPDQDAGDWAAPDEDMPVEPPGVKDEPGGEPVGDNSSPAGRPVSDSAAKRGVGAVVQARSLAAASGWSSFCEEVVAEEMGDAGPEPSPSPAAAAPTVAPADTPMMGGAAQHGPVPCLLPDGALPFYFLDAYEPSDARAGEVFLFGKVPVESLPGKPAANGEQQYVSACAVVQGFHRSVLVVPRPDVFEDTDGSIAELEADMLAANKEAAVKQAEATARESEAARHLAAASKPPAPGQDEQAAAQQAEQAESAKAKHDAASTAATAAREAESAARARAGAARLDLVKLLQVKCADVKAELREVLTKAGVRSYRLVPVKRSYAFENPDVPRGEQWCIKIRYPATDAPLPPSLSGRTFVAIFGAANPCLEALLIKRRVKGPCWTVLTSAQRVEYANQVSWAKVEVTLASPKCVVCEPAHPGVSSRPAPPVTVASISLKTLINPASQQHEVVAAAVVHLPEAVDLEAPMSQAQWSKPQVLRNFCVLRKLDGQIWPPGFEDAARAENASHRGRVNGGAMLMLQASERTLLTTLLTKLQALDADVLVGHNISAFDLHVLLTRMQHHKVPLWSRIGRLKRTIMPKLTGGGHAYGGGASAGVLACVAGRVICDTYLSARELVHEVDYTLKTLSAALLKQDRGDLTSADIPACFATTQALLGLVRHTEGDAWLSLGLMFHLSVLPLTRALTALSGSLWTKTLQGARAQRIEMLLLHEFHARKYLLPDKAAFRGKGAGKTPGGKKGKKGAGTGAEDDPMQVDMQEDAPDEAEGGGGGKPSVAKPGKGPQYLGGLVLEPKKGMYDRLVIMLDFNSLYPSIIQEYNICFSTVERPADGSMAPLPASPAPGTPLAPLPTILQSLVQRRRQAKSAMASVADPLLKQQLNIRQQALKLTANSMYGCLGFTSSRFYAKPLAELITAQGRSILQSTVDLVQGTMGAEVIYGDTDSIMINTGAVDVAAARELGQRIKKEVNKRYKLLEIELDGIFKCMLLLKKKKYAAIKLEPGPGGSLMEVMEQKGLDIVRRDWCGLCKDAGHGVLGALLSCRPVEEVVAIIHDQLRAVREAVLSGAVPLSKFVITKQLTKRPEEYADARSQPHVQVALRRRAAGRRDGTMAGEAVPYVICVDRSHGSAADGPDACASMTPRPPLPGSATTPQPATATPAPHAPTTTPGATTTPVAAASATTTTPGPTPAAPASACPPPSTGAKTPHASSTPMGLAERAYHPDELVESNGRLVLDTDYYLGQQVHPVVSRLVAVLEGTDAARIAECLGLDPGRYRGGAGGGSAGANRGDDADAMGWVVADDDDAYKVCAPLVLAAPGGGGQFEFRGALEVVLGKASHEQLLCPPDAVGDPKHTLSAAQLTNQVLLRSRELVSQYYDGWLEADDELAAHDAANNGSGPTQHGPTGAAGGPGARRGPSRHARLASCAAACSSLCSGAVALSVAGGVRDVVLRSVPEVDKVPHPDTANHPGVLLSRRLDERGLYLQLTHFQRLLDPELAVKRGQAKLHAQDSRSKVTERELRERLQPVWGALRTAAGALAALRAQSAYHWVDLSALFAPLRPKEPPAATAH